MCKALWPPCVLVSHRFALPFVAANCPRAHRASELDIAACTAALASFADERLISLASLADARRIRAERDFAGGGVVFSSAKPTSWASGTFAFACARRRA